MRQRVKKMGYTIIRDNEGKIVNLLPEPVEVSLKEAYQDLELAKRTIAQGKEDSLRFRELDEEILHQPLTI